MAKPEQPGDVPILERPLLIFKVGVLGCAPLDFPEALAIAYDAELLSSDVVRKELIAERDGQGMPREIAQNVELGKIKDILADEAAPLLVEDRDVFLDLFCITPNTRYLPRTLARNAGALSVGLSIDVPPELALDRVKQWTEEDAFVVPISRWGVTPVSIAESMMGQVINPSTEEGVDFVFDLNGTGDTQNLLDQFQQHLVDAGLADRYELVEE